ncbi:MAG TPA: hypothetical protein VJC39_01145 [Candidatus Nanoarchaeia archaeon]|nr:hypothetical protein [Candidatus Nanoarchaeia archaeon]
MAKRRSIKKLDGKKLKFKSKIELVKLPKLPVRVVCNTQALAYTLAIILGLAALIHSLKGNSELLQTVLLSYSPTIFGTIAGISEAAIGGLVIGLLAGWLYNKFS